MTKKPTGKGNSGNKETIVPPTKKELTDASKLLRKGHSSGGRTMADASVAKKEGVTRPKNPKK